MIAHRHNMDRKRTNKTRDYSHIASSRLLHVSHTSPTEAHSEMRKRKSNCAECPCTKNTEKRGIRPIKYGRFNHRLQRNHLFNQIIRPAGSAANSVATRSKRQSPAMITIQLVMAKNIGLIKISGRVGDLQFFQKDGKAYVGLSSQLSKDRIMKDPAFTRTRENMSEFGGAAAVSKSLRNALIPLRGLIETGLHSRFTSLIRQTINLGTGVRGERRVEFSINPEELQGFELNKNTKVSETVLTTNTLVANVNRN